MFWIFLGRIKGVACEHGFKGGQKEGGVSGRVLAENPLSWEFKENSVVGSLTEAGQG